MMTHQHMKRNSETAATGKVTLILKQLKQFLLPSICAILSVAAEGPRSDRFIALGFMGKIPVLQNPDCTVAVIIDFFQVGQKTIQKSCFGMLQPTDVKRYSIRLLFQFVLKLANGVLSRG